MTTSPRRLCFAVAATVVGCSQPAPSPLVAGAARPAGPVQSPDARTQVSERRKALNKIGGAVAGENASTVAAPAGDDR